MGKAPLASDRKRDSYDSRINGSENLANTAAAPISGQGKGGPSAADLKL